MLGCGGLRSTLCNPGIFPTILCASCLNSAITAGLTPALSSNKTVGKEIALSVNLSGVDWKGGSRGGLARD